MRYLLSVLIAASLSSCAFHSGTMNSNANLGANNFEIIELVSVQSSTKKYFGFGGLAKDALVLDAKKLLYRKYPLKKGQVFANISVDFQEKYILFFNETTATISADVVQFDDMDGGEHKLFNDLKAVEADGIVETDGIAKSSQNRKIKCGNESFFIHEKVYYKSGDTIEKGEVKAILNGLVLVYNLKYRIEVKPNSVFHKITEQNQKSIKIELNGVETIGKMIGKNTRRAIFSSENGIVVLTKTESEKLLNEDGR